MRVMLKVNSTEREQFIDIGRHIGAIISDEGWKNGAVHIFCRHTTCGLTINESGDPAVRRDLLNFFNGIAPRSDIWEHVEGNSDAHIRSSLLGVSLLVPVADGHLCLGRWQAIYLYEGDGPRQRMILVQFLSA